MNMKTDWIDGSIRPQHIGPYERDCVERATRIAFSWWDGKEWGFSVNRAKDAKSMSYVASCWQSIPWRGLASKPKEPTC